MKPFAVIGVTATFNRAPELARLLKSLEAIPSGFLRMIVVDNAADSAARVVAESSALSIQYLPQTNNLGCGGGLAVGEKAALLCQNEPWTHLWLLDDDAEVAPDALDRLVAACAAENADVAHPLVLDAEGRPGWIPGLLAPEKWRCLQAANSPADYLDRFGPDPVPFSWSQGIALLVTRAALLAHGVHRADYWVRGEDLEFSLRLTFRGKGVYVPAARVRHLPPVGGTREDRRAEYQKHQAMLQNIAYTALRLPHGRRIAKTIPGNWYRFFRTWGWGISVWVDAARAFFAGALQGRPAGDTSQDIT